MAKIDRRRARGAATKAKLLEAGLALLEETPTEGLFEVLSARRVIARAESSAGAFYHHFDGPESYIDQLMEYSLAQDPVPELEACMTAFAEVMERGGSFDRGALRGGAAALEFSDRDKSYPLQLLVRAKVGRDPEARRRIRAMYAIVDDQSKAAFGAVLAASNRELRPPYELIDLCRMILTIHEGLILRRAAVPEAVDDEMLGSMMLACLELYTRPKGEATTASEHLAELGRHWSFEEPS